jgi:hypothetical protein
VSRFDFAKASIKQTGNRPLDDTQRALIAMQAILNLAPLRRETTFAFPSVLCAAGAVLTARPIYACTDARRKLVSASIVQTNAIAKSAGNDRIYKLVRYRGIRTTTMARASTVDAKVMAFVPYTIPLASADSWLEIGDSLALVLEQNGVGPAVNECCVTLTWEAAP